MRVPRRRTAVRRKTDSCDGGPRLYADALWPDTLRRKTAGHSSVRGAARLRVGTLMTIIPVHACHTQYFHAVGLWTLALLRFGL